MTQPSVHDVEVTVLRASVRFSRQPFVRPLLLSSGPIHEITQADATVEVRVGDRRGVGHGCIFLSDLWAWPDTNLDHLVRDQAMRRYTGALADALPDVVGVGHPLALGLRLHEHIVADQRGDADWPATLARSVCASPLDAAIHDAAGRALGRSAFDLYRQNQPIDESDRLFGGPGATMAAIRDVLLDEPRRRSPAWWIVGGADDLERDVAPAVRSRGHFAFKLKIKGRDARADAQRTAEVAAAARGWGLADYRLSIDSNEANPDAASVLDYLDALASLDGEAYQRLEMIEQPTGRDIAAAAYDWQPIAARKPVLVDEGLLTLASMELARTQGWSGFALKSCKGHSFTLAAAAWAHSRGMVLSLQDLTNPGLAAVHAGLLAAKLPTFNGVELNSPQFTPDANRAWSSRLPDLFIPQSGWITLPDPTTPGLASILADA